MRTTSGIKTWGRPWFLRKGNNTPYTHLLMDWGCLHIPNNQVGGFFKKLAKDIDNKVRNYVIETRTPIFKFHMDLDIYDIKETEWITIQEWIKDLQKILKEFFPTLENEKLCAIVCTTDIKQGELKFNQVLTKVGVHIIWPNVFVDQKIALQLRKGFIQFFENKYGKRPKFNIWEDVFDKCIYEGNGLRMVGCSKMNRCKKCCKGNNNQGICPDNVCNGFGQIHVGRIYKVRDVFDGTGGSVPFVINELQTNTLKMIKTTSIRTDKQFPSKMEEPKWFDPQFFEHNDQLFKRGNTKKLYNKQTTQLTMEDARGVRSLKLHEKTTLSSEDLRAQKILWWFKQTKFPDEHIIPEVFRNIQISGIFLCKGKKSAYYILRTNCSFCLNYGQEHASNTIYFIINQFGLYQKCFCRCDTTQGRKHGRCLEFRSAPVLVPQDLMLVLFPNLYKKYKSVAGTTLNPNPKNQIKENRSVPKRKIDILYDLMGHELENVFQKISSKSQSKYEKKFKSKR